MDVLEIESSFMPWLMEKTMTQVNHLVLGRTILDSIIRNVVHQRIDDYEKLEEALRQVNVAAHSDRKSPSLVLLA